MKPTFTWELKQKTDQIAERGDFLADIFTPYPEHWREWEIASCEEWNSGHDWTLSLFMDDEGYGPELYVYCPNCPIELSDLYFDCMDLVYGTFGDTVIENGEYNYTEDKTFKVNVKIHVEKYTSMDFIGPEYDVWVELTERD